MNDMRYPVQIAQCRHLVLCTKRQNPLNVLRGSRLVFTCRAQCCDHTGRLHSVALAPCRRYGAVRGAHRGSVGTDTCGWAGRLCVVPRAEGRALF